MSRFRYELAGALAATAVVAVLAFTTAEADGTTATRAGASGDVAELFCERPGRLRLRRFEDRSAWLKCGSRLIARIGVPG